MSWSFAAGLLTSVISVVSVIVLWNQWVRDTSRLNFYKIRYDLRDKQLDTTLTEWEKLNKNHAMLLEAHAGILSENLTQSEKIGELQVELSLAHCRNQQVVEQLLAAEAERHALQAELDAIFAVGGSDE